MVVESDDEGDESGREGLEGLGKDGCDGLGMDGLEGFGIDGGDGIDGDGVDGDGIEGDGLEGDGVDGDGVDGEGREGDGMDGDGIEGDDGLGGRGGGGMLTGDEQAAMARRDDQPTHLHHVAAKAVGRRGRTGKRFSMTNTTAYLRLSGPSYGNPSRGQHAPPLPMHELATPH